MPMEVPDDTTSSGWQRLPFLWALLTLLVVGLLAIGLIPSSIALMERMIEDDDAARAKEWLDRSATGPDSLARAVARLMVARHEAKAAAGKQLIGGEAAEVLLVEYKKIWAHPGAVASALAQIEAARFFGHSRLPPEALAAWAESLPERDRAAWLARVTGEAELAGNPGMSAAALRLALGGKPPDAAQVLRLAELWEAADRSDEGLRDLRRFMEAQAEPLPKEAVEALPTFVRLLRAANRNHEAFEVIRSRRRDAEAILGEREALDLLAATAVQSGREREMLPEIAAWLERHPMDAALWRKYGDLAAADGGLETAAIAYRRLVELEPNHPQNRSRLAQIAEWTGKPEEAFALYLGLAREGDRPALDRLQALNPGLYRDAEMREVLAQFVGRDGTSPELLQLAGLHAQFRDYGSAKALYHRHLEARPQDVDVWAKLANLYLQDEEMREALAAYERASALAPKDAGLRYEIARSLYIIGEYFQAHEMLRSLAHETRKEAIIAEYEVSSASLGIYDDLVDAYRLKIEIFPEPAAEDYLALAYYLRLQGRLDEAAEVLTQGALRFKGMPGLLQAAAVARADEGDYAQALQLLLGKVSGASPADIQEFYVNLLVLANRPGEGLAFLRKVMSSELRDRPEMLAAAGNFAEQLGKYAEAENYFRRAYDAQPKDLDRIGDLARIYGRLGRKEQTRALVPMMLVSDSPQRFKRAAEVLIDLGEYQPAIRMLRGYLGLQPAADPLAWRTLGDALLSSGEPQAAKRAYRRALAETYPSEASAP
jgi:tetratricopeptide (TPR) repeat protein